MLYLIWYSIIWFDIISLVAVKRPVLSIKLLMTLRKGSAKWEMEQSSVFNELVKLILTLVLRHDLKMANFADLLGTLCYGWKTVLSKYFICNLKFNQNKSPYESINKLKKNQCFRSWVLSIWMFFVFLKLIYIAWWTRHAYFRQCLLKYEIWISLLSCTFWCGSEYYKIIFLCRESK